MIAALCNQGQLAQIQLFITHSNNKLVHVWIEKDIMHSQFVGGNVISRASAIKNGQVYHIFFVNCSKQLVYIKRNYLQDQQIWVNQQTILDSDVRQCDPICIENQTYFEVFYLDQQNRLTHGTIQKLNKDMIKKVIIKIGQIEEFKISKLSHPLLYICIRTSESLLYGTLNLQSNAQVAWINLGNVHLNGLRNITIQENIQKVKIWFAYFKQIICIQILPLLGTTALHFLNGQEFDKVIRTMYFQINKQLYQFDIGEDNRFTKKPLSQIERFKDYIVVLLQNIPHILSLDQQQTLQYHHKHNDQWLIHKDKEILKWEDIMQECIPIGDQGWHADAFYNTKRNLIVKKMRNPNSFLINQQIKNLQYLSNFLQTKCYHRIINNWAIGGLTMNFIPGHKWDNILEKQENLFARSPIARILFAIKLTNIIRMLQANNFCHGDLHLSNILIDIKKEQTLTPQFDIRVIDFGNGFVFEDNKVVSKGLTGLEIIIPYQVQSLKKKDYNPIGINAHQLGRNLLQILLLSKHSQVSKIQYSPSKQLKQLKQRKQYPSQINEFVTGLLHQDPYQRNVFLFSKIDDLEQKTRYLYESLHKE